MVDSLRHSNRNIQIPKQTNKQIKTNTAAASYGRLIASFEYKYTNTHKQTNKPGGLLVTGFIFWRSVFVFVFIFVFVFVFVFVFLFQSLQLL